MADELLDIVNDEDMVTHQELRSTVHKLGLQHRGAHVFLFTKDGKMLVQKRSADRASSPSMLDCSVSEHVKAGEGYREAALRGLKEEMGVEGIEIKPLKKFRMNYGVNDNEISELYEGLVDPDLVKFDPIEIESVHYYDVAELQKMMQDNNKIFCGWFVELLNLYLNGKGKMQVME
ncbi:MAG: NUDIX domain-containing protein [Anaerolineaceae bacterium]|nr:MAG: NUDIX domain-containing protein [Anaerolineaceae bacterium]